MIMHLVNIVYDYSNGPISEENQKIVEVTSDLIDILDSKKAIIIVKQNNKPIIMIDDEK